jgi:hypothetical protein
MALLPVSVYELDTSPAFRGRVQLSAATVDADGATVHPVPETATPSGKTFDLKGLAAGSLIKLEVIVRASDGMRVLEAIAQVYELQADGSVLPRSMGGHPAVHPRVSVGAVTPVGGVYPPVGVDLTMIDVTDLVHKGVLADRYNAAFLRDPRSPTAQDPHHGSSLHVLEHTRGAPVAWLAIVPPSLGTAPGVATERTGPSTFRSRAVPSEMTRSAFDVTVFFRPVWPYTLATLQEFIDSIGAAEDICRYIIDPPVFGPFFAQHVVAVGAPSATGVRFEANPNAGLEGQLAKSRKKAVLALPMPSIADYGGATSPALPGMMRALLIALQSAGKIAPLRQGPVQLRQLGLSGFSYGAEVAIIAWRQNRGRVDELYLIDPKPAVAAAFAGNKEPGDWLKEKPARKLRLVGGFSHGIFLNHATALLPDWRKRWQDAKAKSVAAPNVWCLPEDPAFWRGDAPYVYYSWAYDVPPQFFTRPLAIDNYKAPPERFVKVGTPPAKGSLSDRAQLLAKDVSAIDRTILNAPKASEDITVRLSHAEVAGFIDTAWLGKSAAPAFTTKKVVAAFNNLVATADVPAVRHQWAMCGGDGDPTRVKDFVGYYYQCLRDGNSDTA